MEALTHSTVVEAERQAERQIELDGPGRSTVVEWVGERRNLMAGRGER